MRILFTCVGRRIELVDAFRRAADALRIRLTIHGADINWLAPAMYVVDKPHIVPRIKTRQHIPALLKLARDEKIDVIIPLIDSDLLALSRAAKRFEALGTRVLISPEPLIRTCQDKILTFRALKEAGVDTPATWTWAEALARKRHRFPYFMKPREGSAGLGNYRINTLEELRTIGERVLDPLVQEFVKGKEHTLDVYTGLDGQPTCVVPRRRIEVRTGEVSKGLVVKDPRIIAAGQRVALAFGQFRGVVTVQCIVTPTGRVRFIEINPRFGGGVPLAIHAGANFPKWLLADLLGRKLRYDPMGYRDGVTMLRYDQSVFVLDVEKASTRRRAKRS
ncbi:MAG TPA: ATP-grasp domain-containing protein [Phycisphaerae bacterium]|nr:ATP-grasp domain-containing protein [Phycisphaerae bacterium]